MFDNLYAAIDWARLQGFTIQVVLLDTKDGLYEYYPQLDPPDGLPGYPMRCWQFIC